MRITLEQIVNAPPSHAYAAFCDPIPFLSRFKRISHILPFIGGDTPNWRLRVRIADRSVAVTMHLSTAEPPHRLVFDSEAEGFSARLVFRFAAREGRRCGLAADITLKPASLRAGML